MTETDVMLIGTIETPTPIQEESASELTATTSPDIQNGQTPSLGLTHTPTIPLTPTPTLHPTPSERVELQFTTANQRVRAVFNFVNSIPEFIPILNLPQAAVNYPALDDIGLVGLSTLTPTQTNTPTLSAAAGSIQPGETEVETIDWLDAINNGDISLRLFRGVSAFGTHPDVLVSLDNNSDRDLNIRFISGDLFQGK